MKKSTENRLSMFKAVKAVCVFNIALINAIDGLQHAYNRFLQLLDEMDAIAEEQTKNRTGITVDKRHVREKLNDAIELSSGIIKAHFDLVNNFDVFNLVNQTMSQIQRMRDQRVILHGQLVKDLLTEHQLTLLPFGVDAAYITEFSATLDEFIAISAKPTTSRNTKSTQTLLLEAKEREINTLLKNELDSSMLLLKATHLDAYLTYKFARRIVNNGIRHNTVGIISGIVKDGESHLGLQGVLVELVGTQTNIITNELGSFTIIDVPPGTFTLKFSIGGYAIKTIENVEVLANETANLEVLMVASV